MSLQRGIDGAEPVRPEPVGGLAGAEAIRRATRSSLLAEGTLACPACDAPVALAGPHAPSAAVTCPYCAHGAPLRAFLSLSAPQRPARVAVRVVVRAW